MIRVEIRPRTIPRSSCPHRTRVRVLQCIDERFMYSLRLRTKLKILLNENTKLPLNLCLCLLGFFLTMSPDELRNGLARFVNASDVVLPHLCYLFCKGLGYRFLFVVEDIEENDWNVFRAFDF